jgi:hypothetical protein
MSEEPRPTVGCIVFGVLFIIVGLPMWELSLLGPGGWGRASFLFILAFAICWGIGRLVDVIRADAKPDE